jgi:hypothetical protein
MLSFTRESNKLFIDNVPITGLQTIQASYNNPYQNIKYLGLSDKTVNTVPVGAFIGALNLTNIMINQDQFIKYTGDNGANLLLTYNNDNNKFIMTSGYLANYQIECNVGAIPIITTQWNIYNNFGSGSASVPNFQIDETKLNIISPGDISINFNDIAEEKINKFNINIKSTRLPIYELAKVVPSDVNLQYPIEIISSFSISLNNYKIKNLFDYPQKNQLKSFSIDLKKNNTNTIINTFNINNALLISEDYNLDVDGTVLAQLTFSSTVNR